MGRAPEVEWPGKRVIFTQRCRVCRNKIELDKMEQHLYEHYNYCMYGHYEEFELYDGSWPKCKNEGELS